MKAIAAGTDARLLTPLCLIQQSHPICTLKDMHYAELTDASWSADGQALCVSSIDGYLSFIQFEPGFFGTCVSEQGIRSRQRELSSGHLTDESCLCHSAQSDSLQERMKTMFSIQKIPRKKPVKQQSNSNSTTPDDAAATAKTPVKKTAAVAKASPLVRSFQKSEGDTTASPNGAVNTLQVRKKRKITPVLVNASASPAAAPESKPSSSGVIDLCVTASPQQQTVTQTIESPTNGTAQDPISINEVASD